MESEKIICKVCEGKNITLRYDGVKDINFNMTDRKFNWFKCKNCGSLQIYSVDTFKEDLSKYYENYDPHTHELKLVSKFSISPISLVINKIKSLKDINSNFSVLDVGCGDGNLLFNLRNSFPNSSLYGIDFNVESTKKKLKSFNINLIEGSLADIGFNEKFDFICNSQLLEHLENPSDLINLISSNLKKNGIAFLDVPNAESRSFKIFGRNWVHLDTPRHRILYTPTSLTSILIKNRFNVIEVKKFGTGFAYLSSLLNLLKETYHINLNISSKLKWIFAKVIQVFIKSDDKLFVVFKLK